LQVEGAREIIYKLVSNIDVVIEGFRPGVTKRLGIDYQTLREVNPRLIYCALSGYGDDGPYNQLPGHDINYISFAGAQDMIGQPNGPHAVPANFIADWAGASLQAAIGILIAVISRGKTGYGQFVDISYLDGTLSLMTAFAYDFLNNGFTYPRGASIYSGGFPCYKIYETKDGKYISIGCLEPHLWENLCRALGREDFIPHQLSEGEKRKEINDYFQEMFLTKTRDEWFELLKDKNIAIAKLYSIDEVFNDPQVIHRNILVDVDHPTRGKVKQVGVTIKLSDTPGRIRGDLPSPGRDTFQVLTELGYSEVNIYELRDKGAIQLG
jgi:crotonobetainyl-CoA:carnitine CoA-transferase CaiB-like acyl-CoA transferase